MFKMKQLNIQVVFLLIFYASYGSSNHNCRYNWKNPNCIHRGSKCKAPSFEFDNAHKLQIQKHEYNVDETVTYECDDKTKKAKTRCQIKRNKLEWSFIHLKCKPILCKKPEKIKNGDYIGDTFIRKSAITYFCNKGYKLIGESVLYCYHDGWSHQFPKCQKINCDQPEKPENGKIVFLEGTKVNHRVEYACAQHTLTIGQDKAFCILENETPKWSSPPPTCKRNCKIPYLYNGVYYDAIDRNKKIKTGSYIQHLENIQFECNSDKVLSSQCVDGEWSINLKCQSESCHVDLPFGVVIYNRNENTGNKIIKIGHNEKLYLGCTQTHHKLYIDNKQTRDESSSIYCSNGELSAKTLECRSDKCSCEELRDKLKGKGIDLTPCKDFGLNNHELRLKCSTLSNQIQNRLTAFCKNGVWSIANDDVCKPTVAKCQANSYDYLDTFLNGEPYFNEQNYFTHGTALRFRCTFPFGFKIIGNNITVCNNGKWTSKWPQCVKIYRNRSDSSPPVDLFSPVKTWRLDNGDYYQPIGHYIIFSCYFGSDEFKPVMTVNGINVTNNKNVAVVTYSYKHKSWYVRMYLITKPTILNFTCKVPGKNDYSNSLYVHIGSKCTDGKGLGMYYKDDEARVSSSSLRFPFYVENDVVDVECGPLAKNKYISKSFSCNRKGMWSQTSNQKC